MTTPAATVHRAFTLIEVLVATIVLGLGVLGLAALFAGAATQQQSAALMSRSVAFTQSGVGLIGEKLSGIVNASGSASAPEGAWDALVSRRPDGGELSILRTRFASFPLGSTNDFGFLVNARQIAISGLNNVPPGLQSLPDTPLPHDKIWIKDGFTIRIDFGNPILGGQSVEYSVDTDVGPPPVGDPVLQAHLKGEGPVPPQVSLWRNGDSASSDSLEMETGFGERAASVSGNFVVPTKPPGAPGGPQWQFVTVVALPYQWFNDLLVSLNDRTQYIPSDTVPGGRLPVMSYSVLYRESLGQPEVAVFTYALRALSAPRNREDEPPFIAPDSRAEFENDEAPLREVNVTLGRDATTGQYYIVPVNEKDEWIVETGQILVMSSIDGAANAPTGAGSTPDPGADAPVRVRTVRTVGGERRGVLDDSPRIGSRSVLEDPLKPFDIHVWAVPPIVRSESSDRTEWRLTPVEISTFKLAR